MKKVIFKTDSSFSDDYLKVIAEKISSNEPVILNNKIKILQIDTETGEIKEW